MPGRFELKPTLEKVWHAPTIFASWTRCRRCIVGGSLLPHYIGGRISASI